MTLKPARLLLALIAVAAVPAFAQNAAVVNGKPIPTSRVDAYVKQVVAQSQGQQKESPQLREAVKQDLIAREVMMQEAMKQGYDKNDAVKQQLETARQNIVVTAMLREYAKKNPVGDAEIKAEYEKFKTTYGDKEYHVRHILTEKEEDAKAIIAKLKAGSKFEDLAKTSKDQGTANSGGDLDWAAPAAFPKPFADALVALQKGAVTAAPVQTPAGWHVIKLDDTRPAKVDSLEELKPRITESLQAKKIQAFQDSLLKKAAIK